jgi:hypothetical protein
VSTLIDIWRPVDPQVLPKFVNKRCRCHLQSQPGYLRLCRRDGQTSVTNLETGFDGYFHPSDTDPPRKQPGIGHPETDDDQKDSDAPDTNDPDWES